MASYDGADAAAPEIAKVQRYTMLSYERLITLWQQVNYLDRESIEGGLVECGTWRGGASALMALAHMASGKPWRPLHLFDSFQGLPEPNPAKDDEIAREYAPAATGALRPIGRLVATEREVRQLITRIGYPTDLVRIHAGWFQETLPAARDGIGPVALLRLDGDWYESTRVALEHLYGLVTRGGFVVIDDYGKFPGCRRAVDEFLASMRLRPFLNHIDSAGRYIIVP